MPDNRDSSMRRFVDWVNADESLPDDASSYDTTETEEADDHHDHEEPYEEDNTDDESAEEFSGDYDGDDEFNYPDAIADDITEDSDDGGAPASEENVSGDDDTFVIQTETLHMSKREKLQMKRFRIFYLTLSAIVAINVSVILLITVNYLPEFGSPYNPAVNEVYLRYVEMGVYDTGSLNMVAAVLFSYRSFDTLGEAFVLFTAVIGVIILMRKPNENRK
ncbi:MAG: hypothetical protein FWD98_00680 [Defluviitaleaceae bacterium]|nr:hypothetical protein [Defluviitaleaceae bacterium]